MKKLLIVFCSICILLEIAILVVYLKTFNGPVSQNVNDWNLFYQIANGIIIVILTIINIAVFYKISTTLDVKGKLFEAQSIITQMRIKDYEYIRDKVKEIQAQVIRGTIKKEDIEEYKKTLMSIDNSFLYKNDNISDPVFFKPQIKTILNDLNNYQNINKEQVYNDLSNFIISLEFYIVQQLIRDPDIKRYIKHNKGSIDSTIYCFDKLESDIDKLLTSK